MGGAVMRYRVFAQRLPKEKDGEQRIGRKGIGEGKATQYAADGEKVAEFDWEPTGVEVTLQ